MIISLSVDMLNVVVGISWRGAVCVDSAVKATVKGTEAPKYTAAKNSVSDCFILNGSETGGISKVTSCELIVESPFIKAKREERVERIIVRFDISRLSSSLTYAKPKNLPPTPTMRRESLQHYYWLQ